MRLFDLVCCASVSIAAGCLGAPDGVESATEAVGVRQPIDPVLCPDDDCAVGNGTGVYFQEDGHAGAGGFDLLITHFVNYHKPNVARGFVGFAGRYHNPRAIDVPPPISGPFWIDTRYSNAWVRLGDLGTVDSADLDGVSYQVASVSESGTVPTWTLIGALGSTFQVSGPDLHRLVIHLTAPSVGLPPSATPTDLQYTLTFGAGQPDNSMSKTSPHTAYKYPMHWQGTGPGEAGSHSYCSGAAATAGGPLPDDGVVFQQGIDVDPVSGKVLANPNVVTLSCSLGAPATAYRWGYDYAPFPLFPQISAVTLWYFNAAIQMTIEAFWTPEGATCLTKANLRRPKLADKYPGQMPWVCPRANGTVDNLDDCVGDKPSSQNKVPLIADAPKPPPIIIFWPNP
jgi:hypothetical protein